MSKELQTLIMAYRVVFSGSDVVEFRENYLMCDKGQLMKLAGYHAVRPVLYQALRKAEVDDRLTQRLQIFASQIAMLDRLYGKEIVQLLKLLAEGGIAALPYKGYLFTEKLYGGQHFRESGDMDIVIQDKEKAVEAINLLCAEGYQLKALCSVEELLENAQGGEVSLLREGVQGVPFHLDFHWEVNESFNAYLLDAKGCFEGAKIRPFLGEECLLPSDEAMFKMLLNHHGGRGLWLRLKELFDFSLFEQKFSGSQDHLEHWADQVRMRRVYDVGRMLSNKLLLNREDRKFNLEERVILNAWGRGESYKNKVIPKLKRLFVYFRLQDPEVNRMRLFKQFVSFHSSYNPLNKYPRPFGEKGEFLNFLVKLLIIGYKRATGTYRTS